MLTLIGGIILLIVGYFTYGKYIEKNFEPVTDRKTPAEVLRDNLDFVPMPKWKNGIIELLNIAGTGPIFGPIMGALYGPVAYIWIIFGCIFAGAVHDYMLGMVSLRNNGDQLPALAGRYIGKVAKHLVNLFACLLLLLVGTVFVTSPANLIQQALPFESNLEVIIILIFIYYLISTVLPIDQAIGKVYPWFGAILILSTIAIGITLFFSGYTMPELSPATLQNFHPKGLAIFPGMFFTISCGAMSGFHATQAPMVSRTMTDEQEGHFTFYGMMIAEGVIAMIWAAAAMSLFNGQTLSEMIDAGTASVVVDAVSKMLLGNVLGTVAILGVIVLPISSGLSAFRSLRIILADYLNIKQDTLTKVMTITLPVYVISYFLTKVDFNILWRYFNWANQVTAVLALLVTTRYLFLKGKNYWVTLVPGAFMLYACVVYIFSEPIGFNLGLSMISYIGGLIVTVILLAVYWQQGVKQKREMDPSSTLLHDEWPILTRNPELAKNN
ncbi:carbon starvation protein A [Aerococcus kribbianus]|uniref:Carbon starvation protein A n=1 Tax=Aerococcus kribbianus TaxID=2999064 RepID=A0A9X3FPI8_9LACT|nr:MULTISPECIES: carbon starvation CstA family protein [unclassified Aerococcus]MCZ0717343.1 carbon starvation protein A [Aerococcus sp. YH-aer221]MCZ0725631.1 carbon starvation protein A [Aerococcus sp. YH-aer222]